MNERPDIPLDAETKAYEQPAYHHAELKLWLRLLTCTNLIESSIRGRLRGRFDVTLPRFDLMAQLDRAPDGMTLSEVSKRMMVSNGNVTHVVEKLVASGDVDRQTAAHDRRVQVIRLTPKGRAEFRAMAAEHAEWIAGLFSGLDEAEMASFMTLLGKVKSSVSASIEKDSEA